jgi:hypothetical protein
MAWKPPEDDETIEAPAIPAPGNSAVWTPPLQDEAVISPMESAAGAAARSVSTLDVPPAPPLEGAGPGGILPSVGDIRETISRFMRRAYSPESFKMEDQLAMTAGKAGPARFLEEEGKRVGSAFRGSVRNLLEAPKDAAMPEMAGNVAKGGQFVADMVSDSLTPSAWHQALGGEAATSLLKGGVMAVRGRVAEKMSGLPPEVSRAIKENPEFFTTTKGTPEALDASNQALQNIIEEARSGHIADRTMAREFIRPIEEAGIEKSVRDIQGVLKESRAKAGAALGAEKEKLGFMPIREEAKMVADFGPPPDLKDNEILREGFRLLRPDAPRGPESIEPLVNLRQLIDERVKFSGKDISAPGDSMSKMLKDLRVQINERIGGPIEGDIERSAMGVPTGERLPDTFAGAPLRAADTEFHRVAKITDPLTKRFEDVRKGVSAVRGQERGGLRSIDPELAALEDLSGGGEALSRAEIAVRHYNAGEEAFQESIKKFDPMAARFKDTRTGMETARDVMRSGTEAIDADMKAIKTMPNGEEALNKLKAEVNRFDADRVDVKPTDLSEKVAQIVGITPARAAKWLSQSVNAGMWPGLSRAAIALTKAASGGPQALATQNYILMQNDDEYRQSIQALQQGDE